MGQKMLLFRGAWLHSWIFVEVRVVQSFGYVIYFIFNIYKRIISLRGPVWTHRASLIPPLFCVSTSTKTEKWAVMYLCVRVSIWFFLRF